MSSNGSSRNSPIGLIEMGITTSLGERRSSEEAPSKDVQELIARVAELERRLIAHDSCPKCPTRLLVAWDENGSIVGKKCPSCDFLVGEDAWK